MMQTEEGKKELLNIKNEQIDKGNSENTKDI